MNFKKNELKLAVKSAVAVGLVASSLASFEAAAAVTFASSGSGYDVETVSSTSILTTTTDTAANGQHVVSAGAGGALSGFYVKISLNSGVFGQNLPANFITKGNCTNQAAGAAVPIELGKDKNYAIYKVTPAAAVAPICEAGQYVEVTKSAAVVVTGPTVLATAGQRLKMTVQAFDSIAGATGTGPLSAPVDYDMTADSVLGSTFETAAAVATTTDVTFANTKFVGGSSVATLGSIIIGKSPGTAIDTNLPFAFASGDKLTVAVTGDFSACAATNCVFYDTDASGTFNAGDVAFTVSGSTATGAIPLDSAVSGKSVKYVTNGTSIITAPVNYTVNGVVSYVKSSYTAGTVTGGPAFGSINSNGISAVVSFLNPAIDAATSGYVSVLRCTNADSVDADVYFTLYLDDGTKSANTKIGTIKAGGSRLWTGDQLEGKDGVNLAIPTGPTSKGRAVVNLNARKGYCMVWNMNTANKTLTSQGPVATGSGPAQ